MSGNHRLDSNSEEQDRIKALGGDVERSTVEGEPGCLGCWLSLRPPVLATAGSEEVGRRALKAECTAVARGVPGGLQGGGAPVRERERCGLAHCLTKGDRTLSTLQCATAAAGRRQACGAAARLAGRAGNVALHRRLRGGGAGDWGAGGLPGQGVVCGS